MHSRPVEALQQRFAAVAAALELAYLNSLAVAIETAAVAAASVAVVVVYFEMNCCEPFDLRIDNFAYGRCVYVDLDVDHGCHVFVCRLRFENLGLSVTLCVGAEAKVHCDDHHQKLKMFYENDDFDFQIRHHHANYHDARPNETIQLCLWFSFLFRRLILSLF